MMTLKFSRAIHWSCQTRRRRLRNSQSTRRKTGTAAMKIRSSRQLTTASVMAEKAKKQTIGSPDWINIEAKSCVRCTS